MPEIFPGSTKLLEDTVTEGALLLVGPPGTGKTAFVRQFVWNGLLGGEKVLCITTDESPEECNKYMRNLGFDIEPYLTDDKLRHIDCYCKRFGVECDSKYSVDNLLNLTDLSIKIEEAKEDWVGYRFVLDSVSTIVLEAGPGTGQKFLSTLLARLKQSKGLGLLTLESGVHDEHFMNFLRFLFDGVLEIRVDEEEGELKRFFRVYSMKGVKHKTSWAPFEITDKGIIISAFDNSINELSEL